MDDKTLQEIRERCESDYFVDRYLLDSCKILLTCIDQLRADLTLERAKKEAAIADMEFIATAIANCNDFLSGGVDRVNSLHLGRCAVCKGACRENKPCKFVWRGPEGR